MIMMTTLMILIKTHIEDNSNGVIGVIAIVINIANKKVITMSEIEVIKVYENKYTKKNSYIYIKQYIYIHIRCTPIHRHAPHTNMYTNTHRNKIFI